MTRFFRSWARPLFLLTVGLAGLSCGGGSGKSGEGEGTAATLELDVRYAEPFSYLSTVRPLPDGRLFAADPLSQVLLRVDMDAGTADTLGRVGGGPGEYQQPDQVYALPGDSTLLVDLGKTQLTVIGPDGTFHDGTSMVLPTESGAPRIVMPDALDDQGRIYHTVSSGLNQGPPDSTAVARYDRGSAASDTLAFLWRPEMRVERSGNNVRVTPTMMEPRDDWAVGADGRLAIIRANGYAVEWHFPDGRVVRGPDTPYEPLSIGEADKEAMLAQTTGTGLMMMVSQSSSGATSMSVSRGGSMGGGQGPSVSDFQWADVFPPFRPDRSLVSERGEVWVQRWLPVDEPEAMDVFDSEGTRVGTVALPSGSRIIGFGHGPGGDEVAYLTHTDEVGLVWLERYRVVRSDG